MTPLCSALWQTWKGIGPEKKKKKKIKGPIYGDQQHPVQTHNRPEQQTSAVDSQTFSARFHVSGYSGCFINIPRTFHGVWLLLC